MSKVTDSMYRLIGLLVKIYSSPPTPKELVAEERGHKNETRALELTTELFQDGQIDIKITDMPYRTESFSEADSKGYDIIVPTVHGNIGIQIKSSYDDLLQFTEHGLALKNKREIPAVVVNDYKPDSRLRIELAAAIVRAYKVQIP